MGNLLYSYKKSVFDEIANNIASNTSNYYAFAAGPVPYGNNVPAITLDDYTTTFVNEWQMLFGKKLTTNDIVPVIQNVVWSTNTIYTAYDSTKDMSNSQFYVVAPPSTPGADYLIYKCIDNANGAASIYVPDQVQANVFYKSDGYGWRYIASIPDNLYTKFATQNYVPVFTNSIVSSAASLNGVDVVNVANGGIAYQTYHDGFVRFVNTSVIQIEANAMIANGYYVNNAIYVYTNNVPSAAQLFTITNYVCNSSGNWVYTNTHANSTNITPGVSRYKISPAVVFNTDGTTDPQAYSIVDPSTNSISKVVVIDSGSAISRANVSVVSNSHFGSGAALYAVTPPAGGHGSNPSVELGMVGMALSFTFANSEGNTILTSTKYTKIGVVKNPYALADGGVKSNFRVNSNTFNQVLKAAITVPTTFTVGDTVIGQTSNATGMVVFSNTTTLYLVGDKQFSNNETVISTSNSQMHTPIVINTLGDVYAKDLIPLYIQNVDDITRSDTESETFKLIIKI